jgi:hypothetical protein
MIEEQNSLKKPALAACGLFVVLLIGAFLLFRERLFFADSAYQAFNIVNEMRMGVYHFRYGAFVAQVFPWVGQYAHWPLHTILVGYAVGPYVFFLLVSSLIVFVFRQYKLAILMALYFSLFVSDSYFLGVEELSQGAAWMFLFFAAVAHFGKKKARLVVFTIPIMVLAFLTFSAHFILIIPVTYLWVYLIVEKENWHFSKRDTAIMSVALISVVAIKSVISTSDGYDSAHLHGITHLSFGDIFEAFATPVVQMFGYRSITIYWTAFFVFIAGLVALFKAKQKMLFAWTILSFLGNIILIGITYRDLDKNVLLFHIELEWKSLAMIIAVPFVLAFLPSVKPSTATIFLVAIFTIRLGYIAAAIPAYSGRQQFKKEVVEKMKTKNIRKLALYHDKKISEQCILEWAIPYETILESAMQGDEPQYTFIVVNPDDRETLQAIKSSHCLFLFDSTGGRKLNTRYFNVDTTQSYTVMTYKELMN